MKLSWAMVVEFGGACNGFFPEAWYVDIPVVGPEVDGKRTLVIASDNNFNATQFTQFVVLTVE